MKRQLFCIVADDDIPGCPKGAIVEVLLDLDYRTLTQFINLDLDAKFTIKRGDKVYETDKSSLEDYWIV